MVGKKTFDEKAWIIVHKFKIRVKRSDFYDYCSIILVLCLGSAFCKIMSSEL